MLQAWSGRGREATLGISLRSAIAAARAWGGPGLYLAPAALTLGVFVYWPLVRTVVLSLYDWNLVSPARHFVGVANYTSLVSNPIVWISVINTAKVLAALLIATVGLPLAVAWTVLRSRGVARTVYRAVIFAPAIVSLAIASVIWLWIYNPINGVLASALHLIGGQGFAWLTHPRLAIWAITIVVAWKTFGYNFVLFLAGLLAIPTDLVEAARLDGATEEALFRRVIWPLLAPTTIFILVTTLIQAPQIVVIPTQILTEGGPNERSNSLGFLVWQQGFELFRVGLASAIAVVVFLLFLALAVAQFRLLERGVHYEQ